MLYKDQVAKHSCNVTLQLYLYTYTYHYIYENNQQGALFRLIYYCKSALHVSGNVFAHQQEHLTVFTVSGSVHPNCCRLVQPATHQVRRKY